MAANDDAVAMLQVEIAGELAELDRITDELIAQFGKVSQRVIGGQLSENVLLQKAMELQAKMLAA